VLEKSELVEPRILKDRPKIIKWKLTENGKDTVPILMSLI